MRNGGGRGNLLERRSGSRRLLLPAAMGGSTGRESRVGSLGVCERVVCEDVWPRRSTPKQGCKCATVERSQLRWRRREGRKHAAGVRASTRETARRSVRMAA